ncbi:hypothetical protein RugamoR57_27960 [Duganella caerulea]|uniref:hypothetical protein n=1 Tax=Duganella caerulea TaxID=2885762 RepID=UPI0030EA3F74
MADKTTKGLSAETRLLAAITFGESSTKDDPDEMFAIASLLVRQRDARRYKDIMHFTAREKSFAFAVSDGNDRYEDLMKASENKIDQQPGMKIAILAAVNALEGGEDKSNGAYFWDGADIKSNYKHHFKVRRGIKFAEPSHNIYGIQDSIKLEIKYKTTKVKNTSTGKVSVTRVEIGRYDHQYDSTAAYGGTIFWKFNPQFLEVTHGWEYK